MADSLTVLNSRLQSDPQYQAALRGEWGTDRYPVGPDGRVLENFRTSAARAYVADNRPELMAMSDGNGGVRIDPKTGKWSYPNATHWYDPQYVGPAVVGGIATAGLLSGVGAAGGAAGSVPGYGGVAVPSMGVAGGTMPGVAGAATTAGTVAGTTAAAKTGGGLLSSALRYGVPAAGQVIDNVLSRRANNQANGYLQQATTDAQALQQRLYDQTTGAARDVRDQNTALYQPYQQAGQQSLATLMGLANQNREDFRLPTLDEARAMPGYQFGLDNGLRGVDRSAAARGGLLTGGAVKAADRYATDYATSKYGELVNQKLAEYNTNTANFDRGFNRNLALTGIGQYGTTGMANAGSDYADQVGRAGTAYTNANTDLITGAANANAGTTLANSNGDRRTINWLSDLFSEYRRNQGVS